MTLPAVHLVLTATYTGFQWTVRALVYLQFALVPPAAFPAYERRHQQRISRVVGPLFAGQGVTTLWLLAARPEGTPQAPVLTGAACPAVVLAATALGAVRCTAGWGRRGTTPCTAGCCGSTPSGPRRRRPGPPRR